MPKPLLSCLNMQKPKFYWLTLSLLLSQKKHWLWSNKISLLLMLMMQNIKKVLQARLAKLNMKTGLQKVILILNGTYHKMNGMQLASVIPRVQQVIRRVWSIIIVAPTLMQPVILLLAVCHLVQPTFGLYRYSIATAGALHGR